MSSGKTLFSNDFVAVKEIQNYFYLHLVRTNGQIVVILPFRIVDHEFEFLARIEICPAHNLSKNIYSITGGIQIDEEPILAAKRELYEEAGYAVEVSEFVELGYVHPSKQSDTIAYLYAVDVTSKEQNEILGDGSFWEQGASVKWMTFEYALHVIDPLFITAISRLRVKNGSKSKAT